jgi:hypothetical protein
MHNQLCLLHQILLFLVTESKPKPPKYWNDIVDVDLDLLKELHEHGSVRILKDRRTDLYDIKKNKSMNKTCLECGEKL